MSRSIVVRSLDMFDIEWIYRTHPKIARAIRGNPVLSNARVFSVVLNVLAPIYYVGFFNTDFCEAADEVSDILSDFLNAVALLGDAGLRKLNCAASILKILLCNRCLTPNNLLVIFQLQNESPEKFEKVADLLLLAESKSLLRTNTINAVFHLIIEQADHIHRLVGWGVGDELDAVTTHDQYCEMVFHPWFLERRTAEKLIHIFSAMNEYGLLNRLYSSKLIEKANGRADLFVAYCDVLVNEINAHNLRFLGYFVSSLYQNYGIHVSDTQIDIFDTSVLSLTASVYQVIVSAQLFGCFPALVRDIQKLYRSGNLNQEDFLRTLGIFLRSAEYFITAQLKVASVGLDLARFVQLSSENRTIFLEQITDEKIPLLCFFSTLLSPVVFVEVVLTQTLLVDQLSQFFCHRGLYHRESWEFIKNSTALYYEEYIGLYGSREDIQAIVSFLVDWKQTLEEFRYFLLASSGMQQKFIEHSDVVAAICQSGFPFNVFLYLSSDKQKLLFSLPKDMAVFVLQCFKSMATRECADSAYDQSSYVFLDNLLREEVVRVLSEIFCVNRDHRPLCSYLLQRIEDVENKTLCCELLDRHLSSYHRACGVTIFASVRFFDAAASAAIEAADISSIDSISSDI